jgi:hypothetical protein
LIQPIGVGQTRGGAVIPVVEQRPEVVERAEVRRLQRKHRQIGLARRLVASQSGQQTGPDVAQRPIVRFEVEQGLDVGELSEEGHRRRPI